MSGQETVLIRGLRCPLNDFKLCKREECGMWDNEWGCCAIVSIAQHLQYLTPLTDIMEEVTKEVRKNERNRL